MLLLQRACPFGRLRASSELVEGWDATLPVAKVLTLANRELSLPHRPSSRFLILASTRSFACTGPRGAVFLMGALYAALKRRSSTVLQGSVSAPCKIEIKVKSSGRECPLHTSSADAARVELVPFPVSSPRGAHQFARSGPSPVIVLRPVTLGQEPWTRLPTVLSPIL